MADYNRANPNFFGDKDALPSGDPNKVVVGAEFDTEFNAVAAAVNSKYDSDDRGANNGIAPLDANGKVPIDNLPLATQAEAEGLSDNTTVISPLRLNQGVTSWGNNGAGIVSDLRQLLDPGADRILFWDDSINTAGYLSLDSSLSISGTVLSVDESNVNHDALQNFVSNEHIDHSSVSVTAGLGLSGGGTIAATRTIDFEPSELSTLVGSSMAATDSFVIDDGGTPKRVRYQDAGIRLQSVGAGQSLSDDDANSYIRYTGSGAATFTFNSGVGEVGNVVIFEQAGTGTLTVSGGTATVNARNGSDSAGQFAVVSAVCVAANTWTVYGDTI